MSSYMRRHAFVEFLKLKTYQVSSYPIAKTDAPLGPEANRSALGMYAEFRPSLVSSKHPIIDIDGIARSHPRSHAVGNRIGKAGPFETFLFERIRRNGEASRQCNNTAAPNLNGNQLAVFEGPG